MEADTLHLYYFKFFSDFSGVKEIDHIVPEIYENLKMMSYDFEEIPGGDWENELGVCKSEECLGICFSVFDILYPMCRDIVFELKNLKELSKNEIEKLDMASRIIICLNGEINTAFTQRKRLLEEGHLKNLREELCFVATICLKFKKSSVCWEYRRLVFNKYLKSFNKIDEGKVIKLYNEEKAFLENHIKKHPRNYYCWTHRMATFKLLFSFLERNTKFLHQEIDSIRIYCEKNIHEYSGFHYLLYLLTQNDKNDLKILLEYELNWIESLIITYTQIYSTGTDYSYAEVPYEKLEALKKFKKVATEMLEQQLQKSVVGSGV